MLFNITIQAQNTFSKTTDGYGIEENLQINASNIKSFSITNKHGNIIINGWDRDTIEIHTLINVNAPGPNSAEEVLDFISIQRAERDKQLIFRTQYDEEFFSNYPFNIDYTINLPSRLFININNNLGDVLIQNTDGQISLKLEYGNLHLINSNSQSTHQLNLNFVEAKFESCKAIHGQVSNCSVTSDKVGKIDFISEYSLFNFNQSNSIVLKASTDRINIEQSDSIHITGTQLLVNCTSLNRYGFVEIEKGQLTIDATNELSQLSVSNKRANTTLILPLNYSYILNAEVSIGQFTHPNSNLLQLLKEENSLSISGKIQSSSATFGQLILFNENSNLTIKTR